MRFCRRLRHAAALAAAAACSLLVLSTTATATAVPSGPSSVPSGPSSVPSGPSSVPAAAPPTAASCARPAPGHFACFAERRTDIVAHRAMTAGALSPAVLPSGLSPANLQAAYGLPGATAGAGQRVYIVDAYDDPSAESDLAAYRAQYGLGVCSTGNGCFRKLNQNGATAPLPAADAGWAGEISLDLDMVSAACPKCSITLIEASDNGPGLYTAVARATSLGARFISLSWGGSEFSAETSYDAAYFAKPGVVFAVASGDSGYGAGTSYPAASRYVVSVGGTALRTAAGTTRGWSETAWTSAGSGCSLYETRPTWQTSVGTCTHRAENDVAAVADPATGLAVYQTYGGGGWSVYGGTSAAAPIIAAVYALAGTPGGTDLPASYLYSGRAALTDVTSGRNGSCATLQCTAGTGWDGPTGLGTPAGVGAFTAGGTPAPPPAAHVVTVTSPGNRSNPVGTVLSVPVPAVDSVPGPLTYTATGLPSGLRINAGTGVISGTVTTAGSWQVGVTATDATGAHGSTAFTWTVVVGCGKLAIANPGFESGAGWTAGASIITRNPAMAQAGSGFAWLNGWGSANVSRISQRVSLPAGCSAVLTYQLFVASADTSPAPVDTLAVAVDGTTVQTWSNRDRGDGYVLRSLSLARWAGRTVELRWIGTENASRPTSFLLDSLSLTGTTSGM